MPSAWMYLRSSRTLARGLLAELGDLDLVEPGHRRRVAGVRGRREQVEVRLRVAGVELHVHRAAADVEAVPVAELVLVAVDDDAAGAADHDHGHLAALQERRRAQLVRVGQRQRLTGHRRRAAEHDPVRVGEDRAHLSGPEQVLHQVVLPQLGGVETAQLGRVGVVPDLHVVLLLG